MDAIKERKGNMQTNRQTDRQTDRKDYLEIGQKLTKDLNLLLNLVTIVTSRHQMK